MEYTERNKDSSDTNRKTNVKMNLVMKMLNNTIGKNIKRVREINDLSQEEVAAQLNIRRQTLSAYETGRSVPNIYILLELASVLRVSIEELTRNVEL